MTKSTDERSTPLELFNELDKEFHFTLDVCASHENHKCDYYLTKKEDGLNTSWKGEVCFMNPPYSDIPRWLQRARNQSYSHGITVVCILPCDTSTNWFHDHIWDCYTHGTRCGVKLRFPKGRFKFGKYTSSPKFATIIVVFYPPIRR